MARKLILVRHGDDPPDDRVVTFAVQNGFEPEMVRPFKGEGLPEPGPDVAGSVVYGGPCNVCEEDRFPVLHDEARWIRACMDQGIPLLGICQGAQQIAHILGAHVGPPEGDFNEFGYYEVSPTPEGRDFLPGPLQMAQSHHHHFDVPQGRYGWPVRRCIPIRRFASVTRPMPSSSTRNARSKAFAAGNRRSHGGSGPF